MKKSILTLCLMLAALPILAQQVSVDDAMASAKKFFNSTALNGKRKVNANNRLALAYTAQADGKNHFYVFNENDADGGFIIVGADEAAQEILGYCDHGNFDYATAPDNFKWWLSQYSQQIAVGIKNGANAREVSKRKAAANKADVPMLIQTTWNQGYPYNRALVYEKGTDPAWTSPNRVATGCVATAMAQIMYYHRCPVETGVGYAQCYYGIIPAGSSEPEFFDANFGETVYDWNSMKLSYGTTDAAEAPESAEVKAVATLMRHCGVSVDTKYDAIISGGSSASSSMVAAALVNNFRYDRSIRNVERRTFSDIDWEQTIYEELAASRPVLYSGTYASKNAGHAFVCDGYSSTDSKYHFNWGWGGQYDGYYTMTGSDALTPGEAGIGGAGIDAAYTSNQTAVIGIKPDEGGKSVYTMEWGEPSVPSSVVRGQRFYVGKTVINTSATRFVADYGLKFTGSDGFVKIASIVNAQAVSPQNGLYISAFGIDTYDIPEGIYSVRLVFCESGTGEWKNADMAVAEPVVEIMKPNADYLIISEPTIGNNEYSTTNEKDITVRFVVKNYLETTLSKNIEFYAYPYGGGSAVLRCKKGITVPALAEQEVEFNVDYKWSNLEKDKTYYFKIDNKNYFFYVVAPLPVSYSITPAGWGTLILPYEQEIPDGMNVYSCSGITDNNELVLTEVTGKMEMCTPYIVSGNPAQFNFNGPDVPNLKNVYTDGLLKGVLGNYNLQSSDYVMQKQGEKVAFFHVGNGVKNGQAASKNRSILTLGNAEGAVGTLFFPERSDDGATKIDAVVNTLSAAEGIYTVGGQRIDKLQKGLNIVRKADGTSVKVLVK